MIFSYSEEDVTRSQDIPPMSDPVSATRVLCGALLLPTIATICGRIFFESINSNFQRTLLVRRSRQETKIIHPYTENDFISFLFHFERNHPKLSLKLYKILSNKDFFSNI